MYKHLHLAELEASMRGHKMEDMTYEKAKEIISKMLYTDEEDEYMSVFDEDRHDGIVNINNRSCLCLAHSHNLKCVCKCLQVAFLKCKPKCPL